MHVGGGGIRFNDTIAGRRSAVHQSPLGILGKLNVCMGLRIFSFFEAAWHADIPALDMAGIYDTTGKTTLALRKRRQFLLAEIKVPPGAVRAPFVDQFSVCGKRNCQGRHGGEKHGPYYYLTPAQA